MSKKLSKRATYGTSSLRYKTKIILFITIIIAFCNFQICKLVHAEKKMEIVMTRLKNQISS